MDLRRIAGIVAILAGILPVIYGRIPSKLLGLGLIASGLYLTMRVRGGREARVAPTRSPTPRVAPVPVPDAETVASLRGPVNACPQCGFLGIRAANVDDGVWPGGGELIHKVCPRCNFRGQHIEFETAADYALFVKELAADAPASGDGPEA